MILRYFIQIENGVPIGYPIQEDNFADCYPDIDRSDLPPNFSQFIRKKYPKIGVYEKVDGYTYVKNSNNFWTVNWNVVNMTAEEIKNKQDNAILSRKHSFMIFDEEICSYKYPIPYPIVEGKKFRWSEILNNWEEVIQL